MQKQIELYLASASSSRKKLLTEAKIPFKIVQQDADESLCDWSQPLKEVVTSIANLKMDHVIMPTAKEGDIAIVLTADTLGADSKGNICGKPKSRENVIEMIRSYRNGAETGTAYCLSLKKFESGNWSEVERIFGFAKAEYVFDVPDELIDWYLDKCFEGYSFFDVSGGVIVDGPGAQFLKEIKGSYTAVVGLPMYELRRDFMKLGFSI